MPLPDFSFQDPITDTIDVPTKPTSETQLRQLLQGPSNELAALYTNQIKPLVNALEVNAAKYAADTGAANSYAIAPSPTYGTNASLIGIPFIFKAANANTGACTLKVNALGALQIKKNFNQDLAANDIKAGQIVIVVFDGVNFQMLSPSGKWSQNGNDSINCAVAGGNTQKDIIFPVPFPNTPTKGTITLVGTSQTYGGKITLAISAMTTTKITVNAVSETAQTLSFIWEVKE